MANSLNKIFVNVAKANVESFLGKYVTPAEGVTRSSDYDSKIVFLGDSGQIFTQGNLYGVDATAYAALKAVVDTLVGSDTSKSVRTIAAEEVANVVDSAPAAFDTLKEIADWIAGSDGKVAKTAEEIIIAVGDPATYEDDGTTVKKAATGLYKLIADNATLIDTKIAALDVTDNTSDAVMGITVKVDETDGKVSKPVVTVTPVKLADAVGMTYDSANKTWSAADGSITSDGVTSATDVAAEIVADEKVIASALNDHETRIKAVETLTSADKAIVTFTAASGDTAATITVDKDDATLTGAAIAEIKSYIDAQDHDHSVTTVANASDSQYVKVTDTASDNDHEYSLSVTTGAVAVADDGTLTDTNGVIDAAALDSTLSSIKPSALWETYSAS